MKSMKLYADVHRIYNNLAAMGIAAGDPVTVTQLLPFDQYHYDGTNAVDLALKRLGVTKAHRILDIGSGIGGPARYIAETSGARVTALELQPDLHAVACDLTARCGLSAVVTHRCGDILNGLSDPAFDGILSLLCMLHIPDKGRLFARCRAALKPGCAMYIEDFARARPLSEAEESLLAHKVQSVDLPSPTAYRAHLEAAGFADVIIDDVTEVWKQVASARLRDWRNERLAHVALHGTAVFDGLEDFYATIDALWQSGALTGLRVLARAI